MFLQYVSLLFLFHMRFLLVVYVFFSTTYNSVIWIVFFLFRILLIWRFCARSTPLVFPVLFISLVYVLSWAVFLPPFFFIQSEIVFISRYPFLVTYSISLAVWALVWFYLYTELVLFRTLLFYPTFWLSTLSLSYWIHSSKLLAGPGVNFMIIVFLHQTDGQPSYATCFFDFTMHVQSSIPWYLCSVHISLARRFSLKIIVWIRLHFFWCWSFTFRRPVCESGYSRPR